MRWDVEKHDEVIIDTYDKEKRHIVCGKGDWVFHICDEKGTHAYMVDYIDEVIYAIENADKSKGEILVDQYFKDRLIYQMKNRVRRKGFIRVVVKFNTLPYKEGKVVTAFMPLNPRKGDSPLG